MVASVEAKVAAGSSIEKAAGEIRPDIELPGAVRWVRRRLGAVRMVLLAMRLDGDYERAGFPMHAPGKQGVRRAFHAINFYAVMVMGAVILDAVLGH